MRRAQARGWQQLGIADSAATTRRPEVTQLTAGESSASQGMAPRPPCPAVIRRALRLGASGLAPEAPWHMGDGHGAEDVYLSVGLTQVVYGGSACMCYNARINLRVPGHCNLQWRRGSLRTLCLGCVWTYVKNTGSSGFGQRVRPTEALGCQGTASWPVGLVPYLTPLSFLLFSSVIALSPYTLKFD